MPPAPAGLAGQIDGVYGQLYSLENVLVADGAPAAPTPPSPSSGSGGSGSGGPGSSGPGSGGPGSSGPGSSGSAPGAGLPTPTQFDATVADLSSQDLARFYAAEQQVPGWGDLGATYASIQQQVQASSAVAADGPGATGGSAATAPSVDPHATAPAVLRRAAATGPSLLPMDPVPSAQVLSAGSGAGASTSPTLAFPPEPVPGSYPPPPGPYTPSGAIGPAQIPQTCPPPPPGPNFGAGAVQSAQESLYVAQELATILTGDVGVIVNGSPLEFPDPAGYVATAVAQVAQVVLDTLNFEANAFADCGSVQTLGLAENIDTTTVNIYDLLNLVASTLGSVSTSVASVSSQLGTVQQTLDEQLTLSIEQALTAPPASTPNIAFELPASLGGNLDSSPVGVQEVVSEAVAQLTAAGEPVNPAAAQDLAIANADLASEAYAAAYAYFHMAYLQAVQ